MFLTVYDYRDSSSPFPIMNIIYTNISACWILEIEAVYGTLSLEISYNLNIHVHITKFQVYCGSIYLIAYYETLYIHQPLLFNTGG